MSEHRSEHPVYPVGLLLSGRAVVVVGGGRVGHRRVRGLVAAGAEPAVISPVVGPDLAELITAHRLTWRQRRYAPGDLAGAWYVVAATDDPDVNAEIVAEAEAAHIFCVRADDGARGSVWTLATGRHEALTIGVSGGGDPLRAKAVRDAVLAALANGSLSDGASG